MPRDRNPRVALTVTEDMYAALRSETAKTGAPVSSIVRKALEGYLRKLGYDVTGDVEWGGFRGTREDAEEGQAGEELVEGKLAGVQTS